MPQRKPFPTVIPVESEDKKGYDKTPPQDHPCSMPRRSRVACCAPPGHGKTSLIKNLLIRSRSDDDPWAAVVVITGVGDYCKEWDKVVHTKTDFATADEKWWAAMSKKHDEKPIACIVDDMNYADLKPKERSNIKKRKRKSNYQLKVLKTEYVNEEFWSNKNQNHQKMTTNPSLQIISQFSFLHRGSGRQTPPIQLGVQ